MQSHPISRRKFVGSTAASAAAIAALRTLPLSAGEVAHTSQPRRFLKTLKIGMVRVPGDLTAKFEAAKQAGFEGIELDSPGIDVEATKRAIDATGLVVDGSVCSTHWKTHHSSPDAATRTQALEDLRTAVRETHAVGGHTVLLVVGHGDDGSPEDVWSRSQENIRQILPLCAELGVRIAIENVWNKFLYDHSGGPDQTAEQFVKYVDEFNSPWIGMQFDIGNHWKYGNPADWIRELGSRIVKLDIKGFDRAADKFTDITEDDLPWAKVRAALDDIGYYGWVAAEVGGGDSQRLQKIAAQIDSALNIK